MPLQSDYTEYRERVRGSFDTWYDAGRDSWTGTPTNSRVTEFTVGSAPLATPGHRRRVLDIGCGRGHQTAELAERLDAEVVGLDLLDVWDAPAVRRGTVVFHHGDFLEFGDGPMDLLVDNGCLHHQRPEEWSAWVEHGSSLLGDTGVWVVSFFLSPHGDVVNKALPDGRHNWWLTEESVCRLFTGHGFARADGAEIDRDFVYEGHRLKYLVLSFTRS